MAVGISLVSHREPKLLLFLVYMQPSLIMGHSVMSSICGCVALSRKPGVAFEMSLHSAIECQLLLFQVKTFLDMFMVAILEISAFFKVGI